MVLIEAEKEVPQSKVPDVQKQPEQETQTPFDFFSSICAKGEMLIIPAGSGRSIRIESDTITERGGLDGKKNIKKDSFLITFTDINLSRSEMCVLVNEGAYPVTIDMGKPVLGLIPIRDGWRGPEQDYLSENAKILAEFVSNYIK